MGRRVVAEALGFAGTRAGMTLPQFRAVCRLLVDRDGPDAVDGVRLVRHGDAAGADADFARVARWMTPRPTVVAHPRDGDPSRAHAPADAVEPAATPLARARAIVQGCDLLLACPPGLGRRATSGTWGVVRLAREAGKAVVVVYPDGAVAAGGVRHYLVADRDRHPEVLVFLDRVPAADGFPDVAGRPVVLEPLTPADRARGPAARPVLGRSAADPDRFREFPSRAELAAEGFVPLGPYRVCDGWADYHFPWSEAPPAAAPSTLAPLGQAPTA
jgi:hypothetical protein